MDILQSLLINKEKFIKRGQVVAVDDLTIAVRMDNGVRQLAKGFIAVKTGDEVVVQGNQLISRRRPVRPSKIYSA